MSNSILIGRNHENNPMIEEKKPRERVFFKVEKLSG